MARYSEENEAIREKIAYIMEGHPEGLTPDELLTLFNSGTYFKITRSKLSSMMRSLIKRKLLTVLNPDERVRVYLHRKYEVPLYKVEKMYGRTPAKEIRLPGDIEERAERRFEMLMRLEGYSSPVTLEEFIVDKGMDVDHPEFERERGRIRSIFHAYERKGLVTRTVRREGKKGNRTLRIDYIIGYESEDDRDAVISREIPIGYLLSKYEDHIIDLVDGMIEPDLSDEIVKCIRFIDDNKDTTPKRMVMRVEMQTDRKDVFRLDVRGGTYLITIKGVKETIESADECIKFIKSKTITQ